MQLSSIIQTLNSFLNIRNGEDGVITLFGGRITLTQLLLGIACLAAIIVAVKFLKKVWRLLMLVLAVISGGNSLAMTPVHLAANCLSGISEAKLESLAEDNEDIRYNESEVSFRVNDTWIDLSDISSVVKLKDGSVSVHVNDTDYRIENKDAADLIKTCTLNPLQALFADTAS